MSKHYIGFEPSGGSDGNAKLNDVHGAEADLQATRQMESGKADPLARDFDEIERAIVALRGAEPGLEPWDEASIEDPLTVSPSRPPSVWLVIGALWLLLAVIAGCAVVTIAYWTPAHAGMRNAHTSVGVTVGGARKHRLSDNPQVKP